MGKGRIMTGIAGVALVAAAAFVVPGSLSAAPTRVAQARHLALSAPTLGSFTPVAADPRLAAMFARVPAAT